VPLHALAMVSSRMPAYRTSGWYAILFILFVVLFTYFYMSVTLAVVYLNYRQHLKVHSW